MVKELEKAFVELVRTAEAVSLVSRYHVPIEVGNIVFGPVLIQWRVIAENGLVV